MDSRQEEIIIKDFGKRLKKIRKAQKLSLRALADLADMSHNHVNAIERGERNPSLTAVVFLANALNVQIGELILLE